MVFTNEFDLEQNKSTYYPRILFESLGVRKPHVNVYDKKVLFKFD